MQFMIQTNNKGHHIHHMAADDLKSFRKKIEQGKKEGNILSAYSIVGGGSVWIVESENHITLNRRLHELGIADVTVTPLVDLDKVLEGYQEFHEGTYNGSIPGKPSASAVAKGGKKS